MNFGFSSPFAVASLCMHDQHVHGHYGHSMVSEKHFYLRKLLYFMFFRWRVQVRLPNQIELMLGINFSVLLGNREQGHFTELLIKMDACMLVGLEIFDNHVAIILIF